MFIEFWWRCKCDNCNGWTWVYESHSGDDHPNSEIYAVRCHHCGFAQWVDDELKREAELMYGEDVELSDVAVQGKAAP